MFGQFDDQFLGLNRLCQLVVTSDPKALLFVTGHRVRRERNEGVTLTLTIRSPYLDERSAIISIPVSPTFKAPRHL